MQITRVAGIPIRLHWSFLGFMGLYAGWSLLSGGLGELVSTALLLGALFTSVVLHELGHAMAARHYGLRTRSITLFPFGGLAAIEDIPADPRQELVIALAGPAVNFALAAVLGVAWLATGAGMGALGVLVAINLVMGVFNLVPAFPMDGGRVLRALLTGRMGYLRGTRTALSVGRVLAWTFVGGGLVAGWWSLALVGGFVLVALSGERRRLAWLEHQLARQAAWRRAVAYTPRWRLAPPRI